jgi:hypothetical protein
VTKDGVLQAAVGGLWVSGQFLESAAVGIFGVTSGMGYGSAVAGGGGSGDSVGLANGWWDFSFLICDSGWAHLWSNKWEAVVGPLLKREKWGTRPGGTPALRGRPRAAVATRTFRYANFLSCKWYCLGAEVFMRRYGNC